MSAPFHLLTLGRLELTRNGEPVGARRRKELALLAYLARRAPRPVDREAAMALFWGDRPEAKARLSLRQALFELRSVVGDALVATGTELRVDPALLSIDATELEADAAGGRFRAAANRWAGPFLGGLEDLGDDRWAGWLDSERAGLAQVMVATLDHLGAAAEAAGDWGAVIELAERQLEIAPDQEDATRRLLLGYRRTGQDAKVASAEVRFGIRAESKGGQGIGRPGLRGLVSPDLIGREAAMAALRQAWTEVGAGVGRVVVVDGPAGIGKSRLLAEWVRELTAAGGRPVIAATRAFASQRDRPWTAIRPLLAAVAATARGVAAVPPNLLARLVPIVPELAERFPNLPPEASPGDPAGSIGRLVAEAGHEQPILFAVDDAPDADGESCRALGELIRHLPPGVLLVLAGRSDAWAAWPLAADLKPGPGVTWLTLSPLSERQVGELIGSTAAFAPAELGPLATRIHEETGGAPGLVQSMLVQLADAGVIGPDRDGAWATRGPLGVLPVGGDFRALVTASVGGLPPDARRLLGLAAGLGPLIEPDVLERASGLGAEAYQAALGALLTARQLREPPLAPGRLEFATDAARRVIYQSQAPSVRADGHWRAARAMRGRTDPQSVAERRRHLEAAGGRELRRYWPIGLGLAVVVAAVAWWSSASGSRAQQAPGTGVLLADFANLTGEPLLDGSLGVVARVGLQQSPGVWVVPRPQIAEALARMGRSDSAVVLRGELAREVALRENIRLILEMDVARAGSRYLVTARLVEAQGGRDLASFSARARNQDAVLDAVARVVRQVRDGLGDRVRPDSSARLAPVTTGSLAALQQLSLGAGAWDRRDYDVAAKHYLRAVELDSTFGMAHARLAEYYRLVNNRPAALARVAAAERFSAPMTEPERLMLALTRAAVVDDRDAAADAASMLATRYPTPTNLANYASVLFRGRRCQEAVPIFRRAIALRPTASSWVNLASCYLVLDSLDAGLRAYEEAGRLDSTTLYTDNINQEWGLTLARVGRLAAADSAFRKMIAGSSIGGQGRGYRSLGYLAMHQGRYHEALAFLDQALARHRSAGNRLSVFRNLVLKAVAAAALGDSKAARAFLGDARAAASELALEPIYYPRLVAAHLQAGDRAGARRWLLEMEPVLLSANRSDSVALRLARALLASAEQDSRAALGHLEVDPSANRPLVSEYWIARGTAYAALGRPDSALAAWRLARGIWGAGTEAQDQWDRLPVRMAEAALAAGDTASARGLVGALVRQWAGADSGAVDVRQARLLWAALSGRP